MGLTTTFPECKTRTLNVKRGNEIVICKVREWKSFLIPELSLRTRSEIRAYGFNTQSNKIDLISKVVRTGDFTVMRFNWLVHQMVLA